MVVKVGKTFLISNMEFLDLICFRLKLAAFLRDFNMALLTSWSRKYFSGGDKNWQKKSLVYKYVTSRPNLILSKTGIGSRFRKGITCTITASTCRWRVGNGVNISFWDDIWSGDCSLKTDRAIQSQLLLPMKSSKKEKKSENFQHPRYSGAQCACKCS